MTLASAKQEGVVSNITVEKLEPLLLQIGQEAGLTLSRVALDVCGPLYQCLRVCRVGGDGTSADIGVIEIQQLPRERVLIHLDPVPYGLKIEDMTSAGRRQHQDFVEMLVARLKSELRFVPVK